MFLTIAVLTALTQVAHAKTCEYDRPGQCDAGQVCIQVEKDHSECMPAYSGPLLTLGFPFRPSQSISCDQGNLSPAGNSHSFWNTAYALDLTTKPENAGTIFAGVAGNVVAHSACTTQNDQCGSGFGNHVKVFTPDGFVVLYAHLDRVDVKTGDSVIVGQAIGLEGNTGWTGRDNRHLHLSVHSDWRERGMEYWKGLGYVPQSVPFRLNVCSSPCAADCLVESRLSTEIRSVRRDGASTPRICGR